MRFWIPIIWKFDTNWRDLTETTTNAAGCFLAFWLHCLRAALLVFSFVTAPIVAPIQLIYALIRDLINWRDIASDIRNGLWDQYRNPVKARRRIFPWCRTYRVLDQMIEHEARKLNRKLATEREELARSQSTTPAAGRDGRR